MPILALTANVMATERENDTVGEVLSSRFDCGGEHEPSSGTDRRNPGRDRTGRPRRFPKGTVVTRLRDEFSVIYQDEDFAGFIPTEASRRSRHGGWPWSRSCSSSSS